MQYYVICRYQGEIMGSKQGVPCHSEKHAIAYAHTFNCRGLAFEASIIIK